ncbi:ferredoxin [Streptomyces sp. NPDC017991]|uniref:ferredoxin n=1 Tax=Streptomyces sp. NPDC017991 TaxID=3365026 RepID=UPI0037B6EDC9
MVHVVRTGCMGLGRYHRGARTGKAPAAPSLCESHGLCVVSAPDVFAMSEDTEETHVLSERPARDRGWDVRFAAAACPTQAIQTGRGRAERAARHVTVARQVTERPCPAPVVPGSRY